MKGVTSRSPKSNEMAPVPQERLRCGDGDSAGPMLRSEARYEVLPRKGDIRKDMVTSNKINKLRAVILFLVSSR
jgi:hypothetical protein